jgi:hypothetical protein
MVADQGSNRDVEDFKRLLHGRGLLPELGRTRLLELVEGVLAISPNTSLLLLLVLTVAASSYCPAGSHCHV